MRNSGWKKTQNPPYLNIKAFKKWGEKCTTTWREFVSNLIHRKSKRDWGAK